MCCDFSVKTMFGLFYSLLLCRGNVLFCYLYTFCVYIYVYWSPTRFRYQMMLVSVDHNMTVSLVKHLSLPQHLSSHQVFSWFCVAQSLTICVVFCRSLFVLFFSFDLCLSVCDCRLLITRQVLSNISSLIFCFCLFELTSAKNSLNSIL